MTDNPCNCSTCQREGCYFHPDMAVARGLDINHPITIPEFIRRFGCMSNPQAREYLMKDVINELNQWGKEAEELNRTEESKAYVDAIALIRDGVKKE